MRSEAEIWETLRSVKDPEVPVLDVVELGIVRRVDIENGSVLVTITPTYSGCPALKMIEDDILAALRRAGVGECEVRTVLTPPWTTDWIGEEARQKLKAAGYSPPQTNAVDQVVPFSTIARKVPCPRCDSLNTSCTSEFGATACKALYVCNDCKEPFEHFKEF